MYTRVRYTRGSSHPRPSSTTRLPDSLTLPSFPGELVASPVVKSVKRNPPTYSPPPPRDNFPTTPRRPRIENYAWSRYNRASEFSSKIWRKRMATTRRRCGSSQRWSSQVRGSEFQEGDDGIEKAEGRTSITYAPITDRRIPIAWECRPVRPLLGGAWVTSHILTCWGSTWLVYLRTVGRGGRRRARRGSRAHARARTSVAKRRGCGGGRCAPRIRGGNELHLCSRTTTSNDDDDNGNEDDAAFTCV